MNIQSIVQSIIQPVVRSVDDPLRISSRFSPLALFALGEQGAWYDPSDLSTLFQDSAGTIPVTAHGQPVGLMLDKSRGLVRGGNVVTNGTFDIDITGWSAAGLAVLSWRGGEAVADVYGSGGGMSQSIPIVSGVTYELLFDVRTLTYNGTTFSTVASAGIPATSFPVSPTKTTRRIIFTASGASALLRFARDTASTGEVAFDNISVRNLTGNHASQPTAASRPLFQNVGGLRYLAFDGVDDFLSTGSINFTGTDKVSVFAGVRKLSDGAPGSLVELSSGFTTNPGAFQLRAPNTPAQAYYQGLNGTSGAANSTGVGAAPDTSIISVLLNIAASGASEIVLRRNAVNVGSGVVGDAGTGNFGNYPLYIGRRAGTSLPFNGHLYGLIIRGALTDDPTTIKVEKLLAGKTGVTLA